jgi:hypothetical protein
LLFSYIMAFYLFFLHCHFRLWWLFIFSGFSHIVIFKYHGFSYFVAFQTFLFSIHIWLSIHCDYSYFMTFPTPVWFLWGMIIIGIFVYI